MAEKTIKVFEIGERLDKTLAVLFPAHSRSSIEKLIQSGNIQVNNNKAKTKYILKAGDTITVNFESLEKTPENISLPIVYEDENVIVLNKPVGILAHTKGTLSNEATVASFISAKLNDKTQVEWMTSNRAGIVHRLDRGTSGVMICAKNEAAQKFLQKQFAKRNVKKTYRAVVSGIMPTEDGVIDIPIERNPKHPATFRAGVNGKSAETYFSVIKSNGTYSLVELKPKTGRTHQLRVHLNYLKHPIVGDSFYSGEKAQRLMLHAERLEITLPNSERRIFSVKTPEEFEKYVS